MHSSRRQKSMNDKRMQSMGHCIARWLSVCMVKPKFRYADFHRNFPAKKVVDTNHESRELDMSRWFVSSTFVICVHDFFRGEVSVKVGITEFRLKSYITTGHVCTWCICETSIAGCLRTQCVHILPPRSQRTQHYCSAQE